MKTWLSYTFEDYPSDSVNACWWSPSVLCDDEVKKCGGFYLETAPLVKSREIYVKSLRVYHLLCRREDMRDWEGVVRIATPKPVFEEVEKRFNVLVVAADLQELCIGAYVVNRAGGIICHDRSATELVELMRAARLVLFPNKSMNDCLDLCAALSARCKVVASDAGAADEYLTRCAIPGSWHVSHVHNQKNYFKACSDLLFGAGSVPDFGESEYVDEAPYE